VNLVSHGFVAAAAYLMGSLPTGFLAGRVRGIDIRTVGSGNIGATNAFRILGKTAGALVLLIDAAKGFLACRFLPSLASGLPWLAKGPFPDVEALAMTAGVAAILGHNYTCWLRFKGGKGVATTAGVLLALFPKAFLIGLGVWLTVLAVSRYVSLASIVAAATLPVAVWWCGASRGLIILSALLGALAIYKHRSNIQRLLNGTEHRIGRRSTGQNT
jgi:acyl phosphate:glycerol-3-phosphate acyltransferase